MFFFYFVFHSPSPAVTEAIGDITAGFLDEVVFAEQTVDFTLKLTAPTTHIKWLKDGTPIPCDGTKYKINSAADGLFHTLTVTSVETEDEGIYTFKIHHEMASLSLSMQGWSGLGVREELIERAKQLVAGSDPDIAVSIQD